MNLIYRKPGVLDRLFAGLTVLALVVTLMPPALTAQAADMFTDSFESGNFSNWTSADNDWHVSSGSGHQGSKKASVYDQGQSDDVLLKAISTSGKTGLVLSYYFRTGQPIESTDHVYVEWTPDRNAQNPTWNQLADHTSINNGSWALASYNLPSGAENKAGFAFRFKARGLEPQQVQGSGDKDEFMIDYVSLTNTPAVVDTDNDGDPDSSDNCPTVANPGQEDTDNDGIGDACDTLTDSDSDTIADSSDNCPSTPNIDQADMDDDGVGDACDDDKDGDEVGNSSDNCPTTPNASQEDMDDDGVGDACDDDKDGDGVGNSSDNCPINPNQDQADADQDGAGDVCDDITDSDSDTIADSSDNCPSTPNIDQADMDDDGVGDACDDDKDGDEVGNSSDNCPINPNQDQADADQDGAGDVCDNDKDGDDVDNDSDNCPATPNASQEDTDDDGMGDVCDNDKDGDDVTNDTDNCPAVANPGQENADQDAAGDACDDTPNGGGGDDDDDVCEDDSALNYGEEGECEYPSDDVVNSCLVPSVTGDAETITIKTSNETPLQTVLDGYSLNVNADQKNYQVWSLQDPANTKNITFDVKVLAKNAGNVQEFGYYKAGATTNFVSVFTIPGDASVGNTFAVTVPASFANSIGFAIKTSPLNSDTWYSEKALNTDGKDNVAVYNPSANTYVVAFEDQKNGDNDYNDLVVEVTSVSCEAYVCSAPFASDNLLANGSFETPKVTNASKWDKYASAAVSWVVQKVSDLTATTLEIQRGESGNVAADGEQYAELDGDQPTIISQDVVTQAGAQYKLSWMFAPRQKTAANHNELEVLVNDAPVDSEGPTAGPAVSVTVNDWVYGDYIITASGATTKVSFKDLGDNSPEEGNDLGTFLDDVLLCKIADPKEIEKTYTVDGYKFNDKDSDGERDEGEEGLDGWTIKITDGKDTLSDVTDQDGYYSFQVPEGTWTVSEVQQNNWTQTGPEGGVCEYTFGDNARVARLTSIQDNSCDFYNHYTPGDDDDNGGGGNGSSNPSCRAFEADEDGSEVTLTWETRNGREVTVLANGVEIYSTDDDEDVDDGSYVHTMSGVTNYELIVERGSKQDECRTSVGAVQGASNSRGASQVSMVPLGAYDTGAGGSQSSNLPVAGLALALGVLAFIRMKNEEGSVDYFTN